MSNEKKRTRVELTEEQKKQQQTPRKDESANEFQAEELEERIAPMTIGLQ